MPRPNQHQEGEGHEGQSDSAFHVVVHAREWSIFGGFCQTPSSLAPAEAESERSSEETQWTQMNQMNS